MEGYTGDGNLFHADSDCALLHGSVRQLQETKALKWGLSYCPDCTEPGAEHVST